MTLNPTVAPSRILLAEILADVPLVEAAALYGSAARGDMESHSDIDLLVLCSDGRKRALFEMVQPCLAREFTKLSLALYSWQELAFLDRAHSLFLLHLKREADIFLDRHGSLSTLLRNFHEKASYRSDFRDSLALLDPLRTRVSDSPNDLHRLSYVYSLFRVFGVYLLADKGIFEFSKSKMAISLSRQYPHTTRAIAALSGLRVLNSNFFSGGTHDLAPVSLAADGALQGYVSHLSRLTETPLRILERPYEEAVAEFVAAAGDHQGLNYRLRTWFLLLAYDGLNLYRRKVGLPPLVSFEREALEELLSGSAPLPIKIAAEQTLSCIRDYRFKYFLNKRAKIGADLAGQALSALASEV
jgi:hypothetical protein